MPDFDIDFCQDNRYRVIEYVRGHYGADAVSQIATFGTMASKAVVRDVGRVLDLPYGFVRPALQADPGGAEQALSLDAREQEPQINERWPTATTASRSRNCGASPSRSRA